MPPQVAINVDLLARIEAFGHAFIGVEPDAATLADLDQETRYGSVAPAAISAG